MDIQKETIENREILHIRGRLDASSSPILEKHLLKEIEAGHKKILLDFLNVEYISSSGLRAMLAAQKKMDANGGQLILFAIDETVMEVITMAGFDHIFMITTSQEKALEL